MVFVTHTTSEVLVDLLLQSFGLCLVFGYSQAIATWEQKDPFSAPTPRAFHTMAWSSAAGGLYVFGGEEGSGVAASPSRMLIWGQVELRCY